MQKDFFSEKYFNGIGSALTERDEILMERKEGRM